MRRRVQKVLEFSAAVAVAIATTHCGHASPSAPSAATGSADIFGPSPPAASRASTIPWSCLTGTSGVLGSACQSSRSTIVSTIRVDAAAVAPGAPLNLRGTVNGPTVTLNWDPPITGDPVTSYEIHAASAPGLSDLAVLPIGNILSITITGVPPGTYYVRVRAGNSAGGSPFSIEIVVIATAGSGSCGTAPGAPTGLAATVSGFAITLTWNAPPSVCTLTTYQIEAGSSPGLGNLASFVTGNTATSFIAPNVPAGTYYTRVRAGNDTGFSSPSNEVSVVVGGSGSSPTVLTGVWVLETSPGNPPGTPGSVAGTREITVLSQVGNTIAGTNYLTGNNWSGTGIPSIANCAPGACIQRAVNGAASGSTVSWKRTATPADPGHVGCDERHDLTLNSAGTLLFGTMVKLADCNTVSAGDTPKAEGWEKR